MLPTYANGEIQMRVESFLAYIEYKITGGSEFLWECYGPNAWCIESDHTHAVIDRVTHMVYEVEVNICNSKNYKWIDPDFADKYIAEAESRKVDPWQVYDDVNYERVYDGSKILSLIK